MWKKCMYRKSVTIEIFIGSYLRRVRQRQNWLPRSKESYWARTILTLE